MCSDHKTLYEIQNPTLNIFFSFYSIQQKEPKDFKNEKNLQILTTLTYKSLLTNLNFKFDLKILASLSFMHPFLNLVNFSLNLKRMITASCSDSFHICLMEKLLKMNFNFLHSLENCAAPPIRYLLLLMP